MNQLHTDRSSVGSWGLTGLAAAVSTTAVAVLLSAVVSTAPAYSAPTNQMPAGPDVVSTSTGDATAATHYCFMGETEWHDAASGPHPTC
jgi:hypothetical protein